MVLAVETKRSGELEAGGGTASSRDGIRSYPLDLEWKRGAKLYVARLSVTASGHLERSFLRGRVVKTRGILEYKQGDVGELPAWLTRRPLDSCPTCAQPRPIGDSGEQVIAAYESGWINHGLIFGTSDLLDILAAGVPGTPGAWQGERCERCEVSPVFTVGDVCGSCLEAGQAKAALTVLDGKAEAF